MEINKIKLTDLKNKIYTIFCVEENSIQFVENNEFFDLNFVYKNINIHAYTNMNREHRYYQDIEIKRQSDEYEFQWTPYSMLLAYYDGKKFVMKINYEYLISNLLKLKEYIDDSKLFFEYYNNDYSKRYFVIDDTIKEMPLVVDLKTEFELRFGVNYYKVEKNKPEY